MFDAEHQGQQPNNRIDIINKILCFTLENKAGKSLDELQPHKKMII